MIANAGDAAFFEVADFWDVAAGAGFGVAGWWAFQTFPHAGQRTFAIAAGTLTVASQAGH